MLFINEEEVKEALRLKLIRERDGLTWTELHERFSTDPSVPVDSWRKRIERRAEKAERMHLEVEIGEPEQLPINEIVSPSYELENGEITSASGTIFLEKYMDDLNDILDIFYKKFKLDPLLYEVTSFSPVTLKSGYKINVRFGKKRNAIFNDEQHAKLYAARLKKIADTLTPSAVKVNLTDNMAVINFCDVHWNKFPSKGFDKDYLDKFEKGLYDVVAELLLHIDLYKPSKVIVILGSDFFQTNDARGSTKKGTVVDAILPYYKMFDEGVRVLTTAVKMIADKYPMDAYYVLANHDETSAWHAVREIQYAFSQYKHVNVFTEYYPFNYVEWGTNLIEITHENLKKGKASSSMPNLAREQWGRTKFHYSIGGHLHTDYFAKDSNGTMVYGSKAYSDVDMWHTVGGYTGNVRGMQAYVFHKEKGNIAVLTSAVLNEEE